MSLKNPDRFPSRSLAISDCAPKAVSTNPATMHSSCCTSWAASGSRIQQPTVIATESANGEVEVAAWNLVDPGQPPSEKTIDLVFRHVPPNARVSIQEIDAESWKRSGRLLRDGKARWIRLPNRSSS